MPTMRPMKVPARATRREIIKGIAACSLAGLPAVPALAAPAWRTLPPTPKLPAATQSDLVRVNGTEIYFAQFGQGPPVLLLHGGLGNSEYWGHQVRHLAERFEVTVMDTRGHGRSPLASGPFSYKLLADDTAALLEHLRIPAASIVGWSDGAVTGLHLAITRPARVTRLFAVAGNATLAGMKAGGGKEPAFVEYFERCRTEYRELSPQPEKWPELLSGLRAMWRSEPNFTDRDLAGIRRPTTIALGEHDEVIRRDHTEQLARSVPGARKAILPGVSHFAMLQNPAQFNAALSEFLSG